MRTETLRSDGPLIPAWAREAFARAARMQDEGRPEPAEQAWRALVARRNEDAPWPEILGLTGIATAWARRRRTFESLVLHRRVGAMLLAIGDDVRAVGVLANRSAILAQLRPHVDLRTALSELERALSRIDADAAPVARDVADTLATALALEDGDVRTARRRLAAHDARSIPQGDPIRKRRTGLSLAAWIAATEGDIAAADARLDEALALGDPEGIFPLLVHEFRLIVARASTDPSRRLAAARAAHRALRPSEGVDGFSGWRAAIGAAAASELEVAGASPDEVHAAHDLVATALLARIVEIDEAVRTLPTLGLPDLDAETELSAFRDSCLAAQRETMQRVARWFADGTGLVTPALRERMLPGGWAHVCAWCQRLRPADGTWLPIGQFLRHAKSLDVTHTICPGCASNVFADRRACAPGAPRPR